MQSASEAQLLLYSYITWPTPNRWEMVEGGGGEDEEEEEYNMT